MNYTLQILQPVVFAVLFAGLYAAEHIFPQQNRKLDGKHDFKNAMVGAINLLIVFAGGYFLAEILIACKRIHFGILNILTLPSIINLIIQVILIDLIMYWWHRINHLFPMLWRFHRFHHLDEQLNSTTTLRFHPVEQVLSSVMKLGVFPLLGFTTFGICIYGFLFFPIIMIHHSNIKLSERLDAVYRKIFISPMMHRIHHSVIKKEADSNYGSVFPVWDIIFKSYTKKSSGKIRFGAE